VTRFSTSENIKRDLVLANRILAHEGVIDGFGHVSVRNPDVPERYFLARSRSPELVELDDILEFTLAGQPIDAPNPALYAERAIHGAIYQVRPDVNAIGHHHTRAVLPFTVAKVPLKPLFHMAAIIGETVPLWDSQPEFGDTNMLVDDLAKGRSLASALGHGRVALLRGHGAVVVGETMAHMVLTSIYLKENAELALQARQLGDLHYLTPGEVQKTSDLMRGQLPLNRAWEYYIARAGFRGM